MGKRVLLFFLLASVACGASREDRNASNGGSGGNPDASGSGAVAGAYAAGASASSASDSTHGGANNGGRSAGGSCPRPAGSITDLAAEPAYSATYLHRWSVDGCSVRLDVLMSRDGGCGPTDMVMGSPLGAIAEAGNARIYVRGDTTLLGGGAAGFQPDAPLPPSAIDTGFRQDVKELWMVPNDDAYVFIRSSDNGRVEAWSLDRSPIGCFD